MIQSQRPERPKNLDLNSNTPGWRLSPPRGLKLPFPFPTARPLKSSIVARCSRPSPVIPTERSEWRDLWGDWQRGSAQVSQIPPLGLFVPSVGMTKLESLGSTGENSEFQILSYRPPLRCHPERTSPASESRDLWNGHRWTDQSDHLPWLIWSEATGRIEWIPPLRPFTPANADG